MSAADASMLYAAAEDTSRRMTTMAGTSNDLLWTDMAALGWLTSDMLDVPLGANGTLCLKVFTIAPAGAEPIARLLALDTKRRRGPPGSR